MDDLDKKQWDELSEILKRDFRDVFDEDFMAQKEEELLLELVEEIRQSHYDSHQELVAVLAKKRNTRQREAARKYLRDLDREMTVTALLELMKSDDPEMRDSASEALCFIDSTYSDLIIDLLKDSCSVVRAYAAGLLSQFGTEKAIEPLKTVAHNDTNIDVRVNATIALGQLGDSRVLSFLEGIQENDKEYNTQGFSPSGVAGKAIEKILERQQK